jgi:hypothetical protein
VSELVKSRSTTDNAVIDSYSAAELGSDDFVEEDVTVVDLAINMSAKRMQMKGLRETYVGGCD